MSQQQSNNTVALHLVLTGGTVITRPIDLTAAMNVMQGWVSGQYGEGKPRGRYVYDITPQVPASDNLSFAVDMTQVIFLDVIPLARAQEQQAQQGGQIVYPMFGGSGRN